MKYDFLSIGLSPAVQKTYLFDCFEAGEVNRSRKFYTDAAGKCINVARVLYQSGHSVSCVTVAGKENLEELKMLCRRDSVDLSVIETSGRTRTCSTIVDLKAGQTTEIVANEPEPVSAAEEQAFRNLVIKSLSEGCRAVIISGSRLSGFSEGIIPFIVSETKKQGIKLFVDYRGDDLLNSLVSDKIRPDFVKINESEFFRTFEQYSSLEEGITELSEKYKNIFIITRGADATIAVENGKILKIKSKTIKALNPIGCGDSMTAGIASGIIEGLSVVEAVEKGRDYGALNALSIHPGWILEEHNG